VRLSAPELDEAASLLVWGNKTQSTSEPLKARTKKRAEQGIYDSLPSQQFAPKRNPKLQEWMTKRPETQNASSEQRTKGGIHNTFRITQAACCICHNKE